MKKTGIVVIGVFVLLIIFGGFLWNTRAQKVEFIFPKNVEKIKIVKKINHEENQEIAEVTKENPEIKLNLGEYYYVSFGENLANKPFSFLVEKGKNEVEVNYDFSEDFYNKIEDNVKKDLQKILSEKFPVTAKNFNLEKIYFYEKGDFIAGILTENTLNASDFYKVIFIKNGANYEVYETPQLYFYKKDFPKIPEKILDNINKL